MAGRGAFPDLGTAEPKDFYKILDIERDADAEQIKRAYRRKALRYHPDKTGHDPDAAEQFQLVQRAYEVLSDDKKRAIFDKYGERGILMMEQMGEVAPFIDPDIILAMNKFFFIGTLLTALLILFPSFISVRADHKVFWSWAVVFIPLFIIDALLLYYLLTIPTKLPGAEEDDDHDDRFNEDRDAAMRDREKRKKEKAMRRSGSKVGMVGYFLLVVLFEIFVVLRLDGKVGWSWGAVFAPWFIVEAVNSYMISMGVVKKVKEGVYDLEAAHEGEGLESQQPTMRALKASEIVVLIADAYVFWILRLAQAALIAAKVGDGPLQSTAWGLIFLPTWLWGLTQLLSIVLACVAVRRSVVVDAERKKEARVGLIIKSIGFAVVATLLYVGVGLLVKRLANEESSGETPGAPSMGVIFIPTFIVLGLLFCCFCCCLPCLVCCFRQGLEAELAEDGVSNVEMIPSDRRITYGNGANDRPGSMTILIGEGTGSSRKR
ncbi:hypothetical protein HK097_002784 [Rhizophlyctis rosea]|uniref:J domain-containing protein n=1 Tax=Rhizophlyctis rosea TaxID=64517 RepID=A0AAD5SH12_9FUNG|nr:hypothetical protein HK097_002784 [Rhizophlyctis rosea]